MFKVVREFVEEVMRLQEKYGYTYSATKDKSLDELTEMWINNFFEPYFLEDYYDEIESCGAKKYAQYYLHIRGVVPECEVTMWR